MQIGIKGTDYIYLWNVKKNKQNKVFFRFKNQMYKVYRSELRRMFVTKYGEFDGTDEVIIFREESIQPYHPRGMNYDQDATLMDIDARKFTYKSVFKSSIFAKLGGAFLDHYWPVVVIGISGIVVLFAFMGGL